VTLASVGTTAEVLAVKEDLDNLSGIAAARIKAIGRQRFKVLSTTRQLGGFDVFFVDVHIHMFVNVKEHNDARLDTGYLLLLHFVLPELTYLQSCCECLDLS